MNKKKIVIEEPKFKVGNVVLHKIRSDLHGKIIKVNNVKKLLYTIEMFDSGDDATLTEQDLVKEYDVYVKLNIQRTSQGINKPLILSNNSSIDEGECSICFNPLCEKPNRKH